MSSNATTSSSSSSSSSDGERGADDSIYFSVFVASLLFVFLLLVFDAIRARLWWVYEPRLHHAAYKRRTPAPPGRGRFRWAASVMRLWSDEDFLVYGGVDGLVIIYFLRFAFDQCLFASVVGLVVLVPAYHSGRGVHSRLYDDDGAEKKWSFSLTTVQNIRCRFDERDTLGENPLFPTCENGESAVRFALVVACAWLFTLRALSQLSANYQKFVHLRHWYLSVGLSSRAPDVEAQRALTVKLENVPRGLRTTRRLAEKFETLCGAGAVHSASVMIDGLRDLDRLCARRDAARDALEDALSKRAKHAHDLVTRRQRSGSADSSSTRGRSASDATTPPPPAATPPPKTVRVRPRPSAFGWVGETLKSATPGRRRRPPSPPAVAPWFEQFDETAEWAVVDVSSSKRTPADRVYASAGGATASHQRRWRSDTIASVDAGARRSLSREPPVPLVARRSPGPLTPAIPEATSEEEREDVVLRHVPCGACGDLGCLGGLFGSCGGRFDGKFVASIPYYEQLVAELNQAILREHFARVAFAELPKTPSKLLLAGDAANDSRRTRGWRGCFWRVDDDSSGDDDDDRGRDVETPRTGGVDLAPSFDATPDSDSLFEHSPSDRSRRAWERTRRTEVRHDERVLDGEAHWVTLLGSLPFAESRPLLLARSRAYARAALRSLPLHVDAARLGAYVVFRDYVCCGARPRHKEVRGGDEGFAPSATAFVTFRRPTAKVLAKTALLSPRPFAMRAEEAPEPRDVIWENVYQHIDSVKRRQWMVNGLVVALMLFWTTITGFCANATKLVDLLGYNPRSALARGVASILPVVFLLSILNLLPLIFQVIGRFYERLKSHSEVDLSVVDRFFRFQFINVYAAIVSSAILSDVNAAWKSPLTFVTRLGFDTPEAAFYFAKLIVFQCGSSPLWLLRAWPLLSRGFKTWTVQPPELPGMLYGWAFPKVMMTFTIFSTFWVFAPLLSVISLVYFALVGFAFRYLILFVHMPVYESGGRFYYEMIDRVLFALTVSNGILFCWLLARSLVGYALLVLPLPFVVKGFGSFAEEAYGKPSRAVSLDVAVKAEAERAVPSHRFDATLYRQPALRNVQGATLDADRELSALLLGQTPRPSKRREDPHPLAAIAEVEDAARRAARVDARHLLETLRPDVARPHEATRADRRRVSDRLDAAYRGQAEFFNELPRYTRAPPPRHTPPGDRRATIATTPATAPRTLRRAASSPDGDEPPGPAALDARRETL